MLSRLCVLSAIAMAAGCTSAPSEQDSGVAAPTAGPAAIPEAIAQSLAQGRATRALVRLDLPQTDHLGLLQEERERGRRQALLDERAMAWQDRADTFVGSLPAGARLQRTFRHVPVVVIELQDLPSAL